MTVLDAVVRPKVKKKTGLEKEWKVVFWDDDETTFEFVINLLMEHFKKTSVEAIELTNYIDQHGSGVAGMYNLEVADTKAYISMELARKSGFPFKVTVEQDLHGE